MTLRPEHEQWLRDRDLSVELAQKFGLETTIQSFPTGREDAQGRQVWEKALAISVPYLIDGKVVNHKHRRTSTKQHMMDKGGKLALWNHDCLRSDFDKPLVITEGEWDAIAALQLGWRAVSVPNGTSSTKQGERAKAYQYIWDAADLLNKQKHFILATDGDAAGLALRADLAALLGPERCSFIEYPEATKDLNEVLVGFGAEAVSSLLHSAKPYPVKGIYQIDDFPEKAAVIEYPIGIGPLTSMMSIVPGTLTVFTGYANMGKSTVMNGIVANLLSLNIPVCIASFETEVKPILRDGLRAAIMGCAVSDLHSRSTMEADRLLHDNLSIITQLVDEDDEMDLDFFLDLCRTSVIRDGTKVIILDPWNELEHKRRRDETETDYISRALRAIKRFARQHDVAFWIVAHPTKPYEGRVKMPKLYDISGSANWANKADYGLSYHRPDPSANEAEFCVCKVRMGLPGRKGSVKVNYDFRVSQFVEAAH